MACKVGVGRLPLGVGEARPWLVATVIKSGPHHESLSCSRGQVSACIVSSCLLSGGLRVARRELRPLPLLPLVTRVWLAVLCWGRDVCGWWVW